MKRFKNSCKFFCINKIPRNLFGSNYNFLTDPSNEYIQPDKSSLNELIPIFGLYGVVIIRLIPLFTKSKKFK